MKTLVFSLLSLFFAAGVLFTVNSVQSDNLSDLSRQNIEAMAADFSDTVPWAPLLTVELCYQNVSIPEFGEWMPIRHCPDPEYGACVSMIITYYSDARTCLSNIYL